MKKNYAQQQQVELDSRLKVLRPRQAQYTARDSLISHANEEARKREEKVVDARAVKNCVKSSLAARYCKP